MDDFLVIVLTVCTGSSFSTASWDTFATADREPLLCCGNAGASKVPALLPVAGVGQEVDQEADGNSAVRI